MKLPSHSNFDRPFLAIIEGARRAARLIPPAFPLSATVAVNPYLGHTGEDLAQVGAKLARAGGLRVTLARAGFRTAWEQGQLTCDDLRMALALRPGLTLARLEAALTEDTPDPDPLPTVAELAARASGIDWPEIVAARIGAWAAGYFDQGQALWPAPQGRSAYDAWRAFASHDLTPEIMGLRGFCNHVADAPDTASLALLWAADQLGLGAEGAESAAHRWLIELGGWAQVARWKLWQAELDGQSDDTVTDFLALRMIWDAALLAQYHDQIAQEWQQIMAVHATPAMPCHQMEIDALLQLALELAHQRGLQDRLAAPVQTGARGRPSLQAVFCIDVRSERYRRALESCDAAIQTLGFAGFFGLPLAHKPLGACGHEAHLPVLLNAALETSPDTDPRTAHVAQITARAWRAWGRFKLAAVSSFAFVEATGPLYLGKIIRDSLGLHSKAHVEPAPHITGLDLAQRAELAAKILRAMGLTQDFAPVVLLVGHGAHVTNNPHQSALQCGACGGHSGEVSARALAGLLNDAALRAILTQQGITIPADTRFLGAMHDTTADHVALYEPLGPDQAAIRRWLDQAGALARSERATSLPHAGEKGCNLPARALDWAETRPEWGLAGCSAFIAAPRDASRGRDLAGRAFLHDYDWQRDTGFGTLELILTAPVVVASWISLQYYGSVTAPQAFGAGNKLLHNVVGGFGVFEGNGHAPRTGLAWQSVHDGVRPLHDPLRLSVIVRAPSGAVSAILDRHPQVRALFDNGWLHLILMDDEGRLAQRYHQGSWQGMWSTGLGAVTAA
ncbi:hypothetical protein LY56_00507 [Roseinatronobacter thiooxidans]|uniref:Probable inorganic carbon transporter subunit DabA n=1 Tax=Roseinatronobacter thiooxidans TaxID=121821 RepID=A0A2W7S9D7_9RHOB|nr:DUF2309 domain-containing protein [Roseinatronobacter thiooxidans]PZX47212.1 hypothetical protein LY56_00507 [Roseinatronobacter thiooxidans]